MKRKKQYLITFDGGEDQKALILAQLGIGNKEIARRTGLSSGQINYRCHKAKVTEGVPSGYRVGWRNGEHPLLKHIMQDYSGVLKLEIERKIVPKLVHPTPKMVKLKESPAPTVGWAMARMLKGQTANS